MTTTMGNTITTTLEALLQELQRCAQDEKAIAARKADLLSQIHAATKRPAVVKLRRGKPRKAAPPPQPKSTLSPQQAQVLAVFNGKPMRYMDVRNASKTARGTGVVLAALVRKGRLHRVREGLYQKVK